MYLHTPLLEVDSWWRTDTAAGSNTPTTVYAHDGSDPVGTSLGTSGSTVRNTRADGTGQFWSAAATLYCKELTYKGTPNGNVVTSTGIIPAVPGLTPALDLSAIPTTYVRLGQVRDGGLFVSQNGSDTNDGLSLGSPLKTVTAAIAKAQTAGVGAEISMTPGQHNYGATDGTGGGSTIRLINGIHLHGISSDQLSGTQIRRTVDNGAPMFDSDPAAPLAGCIVEDLHIMTNLGVHPTGDGTSHGFKLYCLTNNSAIRRVAGQRLRGDVVNLNANVTTGDTVHSFFNAELVQVFGISCGGYVVGSNGVAVGTIRMPDGSNMVGGLLKQVGGQSNQAALVIEQPMWEGGTSGASLQPVLLDGLNSQPVVVIGGEFNAAAGSTDAFKIKTSSASLILLGCSGNGFTNWINDIVNSFTYPITTTITYVANGVIMPALTAQGSGAFIEYYDTAGTTNQRRWRLRQSGAVGVFSMRNDAGSNVRDIYTISGSDGSLTMANAFKVSGNVGFYGTAPAAKQTVTGSRGGNAALASLLTALSTLGLLTDSSTA